MFETLIFWGASILSLLGAYLVGEHNKKGFLCWMVSNPILLVSAYTTQSYYNVFMFGLFWIFALRGWRNGG